MQKGNENYSKKLATSVLSYNISDLVYKKEIEKKINLNDNMLRTFGALGISIKREVAKNEIRLRASKFEGMSSVVSLTVRSKRNRLICEN